MLQRGLSIPLLLGCLALLPPALLGGLKLVMKAKNGSAENYRVWTDNTGTFSARARLTKDNGASVLLEREDSGKFVTVPISRLSEKDRFFLETGAEAVFGNQIAIPEGLAATNLFPNRLGQYRFSSFRDLWHVMIAITPMWATLVIPLMIGGIGYFWYLRSVG